MRPKGWKLKLDLLECGLAHISTLTVTGTNCRGQRLNSPQYRHTQTGRLSGRGSLAKRWFMVLMVMGQRCQGSDVQVISMGSWL